MVIYLVPSMGGMKVLREVQCKACGKIGLTCYAQCQDPECGIIHKVEIHD